MNTIPHLNLQFNDDKIIKLSTSSFLYTNSTFLQSFDLNEDDNIPILCPSSYIIDNDKCIFDDKTDLLFIFTLSYIQLTLSSKFINICNFLDIIHYDNKDNIFSEKFIRYIMYNFYILNDVFLIEDVDYIGINKLQYFMQNEIKSIINYIKHLYNKSSHENEIMCCTSIFYSIYLTEYKEEVIKYNRIDIYEVSLNKNDYYQYIHKYDNQLTYIVKETQEYKNYIGDISYKLIREMSMYRQFNLNAIKKIIEQGANIRFTPNYNDTIRDLIRFTYRNEISQCLEILRYCIEHGFDINIPDNYGDTALHHASRRDNIDILSLLIEYGANVNLQNNNGETALHCVAFKNNKVDIIQYLIEHGANVNLQNNKGETALHIASRHINNLQVIKCLVEYGANINIKNKEGFDAFVIAYSRNNNKEVVNYLKKTCKRY